jgi:hypothetical protein
MDRTIPDIEWCREISSQLGIPTRCPFSTVDDCPRYYQSLSLLSSAGHTAIPPEKDSLLLKKWKRHYLWPTIAEQATSVSGSPDRRKTFSNFCPEVAYDRFGFFASELYPYHDEIDQDNGIKIGKREGLPNGHWVFNWSHVEKVHYTDCPIYSPLKTKGSSQSSDKSLLDKVLLKIRNNPLIAIIIIISTIVVGISTFTDSLVKIKTSIDKLYKSSDVTKAKGIKPENGMGVDGNDDKGLAASQNSDELIKKVYTILKPPFVTKVSRFAHGPSDCVHHAVETLSVNDFKVDLNGLTCSYAINKHNTGNCKGLPFDEDRPTFYGQVVAQIAMQNNRVNIFNIKDNYPNDLEQDTKAGSPLINHFRSKNGSIIK